MYLCMLEILLFLDHLHLKPMNEYSLHSALKNWYSLLGDKFEVKMNNFVVDIVRAHACMQKRACTTGLGVCASSGPRLRNGNQLLSSLHVPSVATSSSEDIVTVRLGKILFIQNF